MEHDVRHLDLFVTEACNLACPYCFASAKPRRAPTWHECRHAVDWLIEGSRAERVHITLWGGEPLLRISLLEKIVDHARNRAAALGKRLTLSMPTNATLLDDEALRWIRGEDIQVFLSIDGDETTQAGRPTKAGDNSHRLAAEGLHRVLAYELRRPVSVRMTITPSNAALLADNVDYFFRAGVRELLIYPALDTDWSDEAIGEYTRGQREVVAVFGDLVRGIDDPRSWPVLKAWRPILRRLLDGVPERDRGGKIRYCGAGTRMVAIGVDGTLSPCHRFVFYARERDERFDLGAFERGLRLDRGRSIGELKSDELRGVARCVECDLYDLCTFSCVAINYATTGSLRDIPHVACKLMKAQVEACRALHSQLAADPRYARYLGRSLSWALLRASDELGERAWELYGSSSHS